MRFQPLMEQFGGFRNLILRVCWGKRCAFTVGSSVAIPRSDRGRPTLDGRPASLLQQFPESREGFPMIALHVKALAPIGYSTDQYRLAGAVVVARIGFGRLRLNVVTEVWQVEDRGSEV